MQIQNIEPLAIDGVFVLTCKKNFDERGYFSEVYRKSDFHNELLPFEIRESQIFQINESYSKKNTFRGLHYQSEPKQAKCVRCLEGHLIDIALDIRVESKTYGKVIAYEILSRIDDESFDWIWLPDGIAHGTLLLENSKLQYLCTSEWNPESNYAISIFSPEIDWSLCESKLKSKVDLAICNPNVTISTKDKTALQFHNVK